MRWLCAVALALVACKGGAKHEDAGAPVVPRRPVDAAAVAIDAPAPRPARTEHAVFSLADNRHAAHRFVDGDLAIDAGDVGLAKYTRFGVPVLHWHLGKVVDGQRAATADRFAALEVPIAPGPAAAATQLVLAVHGEDKQQLALKVNGKRQGKAIALHAGWQTVAAPLAKGALVGGENLVAFETSGGKLSIAIAWLRIGVGEGDPRGAATFDRAAIGLAKEAGLTWYVTIPDGANLVADVAAPCKVEVQARTGEDSFAGGVLSADSDRVDLGPVSGKVVGLTMIARDCPRATIANARITLVGPEPARLPKAEPPRYVVLWVMDALRADHLPVFTPGARPQTPNMEELAKTSTVFRQYYVQGNESQVSHSTLWTSLYPANHNVRMVGAPGGTWLLDHKFPKIATLLTTAGYYTTAVTGNGFVNADGGYDHGFVEFRNMMRETGIDNNLIYGQIIVDAALKQLDKRRAAPTYLFLGTIDTHGPWVARKPWIDIYSPGPYHGPFQEFGTAKDLGIRPDSMGCSIIPPKEDIERLRAIYDSAISYHDQQLGRFVEQLKSWGIWDQTLFILTADHGEELFEDNRCGHGGSLRDSLVRVPMLIHDPSRFPAGTIVDEGAEGVDLLPTIMDAIGQPAPDQAQGEPLEAVAQGLGRGWAKPSYTSMYELSHTMRIGRWKLRINGYGAIALGDLVGDPGELKDQGAGHAVERRMLTDNLSMFLALRKLWKKTAWGVVSNVTAAGAAALDQVATP